MGVSFDSSGLAGSRTVPVPAFQVQVGVGEEFIGAELRLFSTQASGRYHERLPDSGTPEMPADRLALDALGAVRPLAVPLRDTSGWVKRSLRSLTVNLGFAAENATIGTPSVIRWGLVLGGHIDFPLSPADTSGVVALRLTARRLTAGQHQAGTVLISDTALDLFGGVSVSF